ncbi:MAG: C40 family peptidase [Nitrospira sp.]|nr:C40 family peptidase [Nitrospira sp.]
MIELVQDLLGTPYRLGARLPGAATDCFGLVVECCRRMGRPIPDPYVSAEVPVDAKHWIAERLAGWRACGGPVVGGVVELRTNEHPAHVGFLVSETEFLHSMRKTGAVLCRLDREPWCHRIVGFYVYGH